MNNNNIDVYLDADGVLFNFIQGSINAHGKGHLTSPKDIKKWHYFKDWDLTEKEFWDKCRGVDFWANLPVFPWAKDLVKAVSEFDNNFMVCTTPSADIDCPKGKLLALQKHFNIPQSRVILMSKKYRLANSNSLLIDDSSKNIRKWREHGGMGILFSAPDNNYEGMKAEEIIKLLKEYPNVRL